MAVSFPDVHVIQAALADVLKPTSFNGWVLLRYQNDNAIVFQAKGNGGVAELVPNLKDDEVQYALVRLHEKKGTTDTSKDVYIAWTGPGVSKIKAAKKNTHSGDVQKILAPNHAQLTAVNRANFNEQRVRERADPQAGSHIID
eukprot:TRINITY_DN13298_c0_g1_i1.p2 TRINITY_DN13298_c0_g1~~TRINITY_DN13298_c0_g1_i1.p2  ORF type:complete len:143 (-),score=49.05 TRINITY_DN13298_c0_g1_i1:69-497(-)